MKILHATACVLGLLTIAKPSSGAVISFYDFSENSPPTGSLSDTGSGAPLNLTKIGSPTYSTDTPVSGTGFAFGGDSLLIGAPNSYAYATPGSDLKLQLQQFTVEAWIKPSVAAAGTNTTVFGYQPAGADHDGLGYQFYLSSTGDPSFSIGDGSAYLSVASPSPISNGVWHQIAGSDSNGVLRLFVDGTQVATSSTSMTVDYASDTSYGPNVTTEYLGIVHNANAPASGPTDGSDLYHGLPQGTLLDRVMVLDQAISSPGGNGSQAPALDYFTSSVPEPTSLVATVVAISLSLCRRKPKKQRG